MNTKRPAGEKLPVGMDLGGRHHHGCVLDAAGGIPVRDVITNAREVVSAYCARHWGATIVMETGTHSPWVSRLVTSLVHPVIVANARKLRAIPQSQTKCDDEDAELPAHGSRHAAIVVHP